MINIRQKDYDEIAGIIYDQLYAAENNSGVVEYQIIGRNENNCVDELLLVWEVDNMDRSIIDRWLAVGFRGGVRIAIDFDINEINIRINN